MRNRQSHKSDHSAAADHTCAQCRHGQHQQWFEPLHPHPRELRRPVSEKQHVQFRCKTEQNATRSQPHCRKQDHIAPGDPPESPQQPEHQCRKPFIGEIQQVPPAYSALKINGQRAYDLARKGVEFSIPPREVEIFELELVEILPANRAKFRVVCSKGTYVRTLGHDIAQKLGTLGYLQELRRLKCGQFDLRHKILLENLENMVYGGALNEVLLPIETFLCDITVIAVSEVDAAKLKLGQALSPRAFDVQKFAGQEAVAVCEGKPVAVVRIEERRIAPVRVFNL